MGTFKPETLDDEHVETEIEEVKEIKPIVTYLDKTAREEVISRTLAAYIEVCSSLKVPQRGLNALQFHRNRCKSKHHKNFPQVKNVNVYNASLKGFAVKGNYTKLQEVLSFAKEDSIQLNVQSYASIFECLGRVDVKGSHLKEIRIQTREALKNGITFDKIMNEASFLADQRTMVLRAMQTHTPTYEIKLTPPQVQYNNHLVNSLNNENQLKQQDTNNAQCNTIFTSEKMKIFINEQIELEKLSYITVSLYFNYFKTVLILNKS